MAKPARKTQEPEIPPVIATCISCLNGITKLAPPKQRNKKLEQQLEALIQIANKYMDGKNNDISTIAYEFAKFLLMFAQHSQGEKRKTILSLFTKCAQAIVGSKDIAENTLEDVYQKLGTSQEEVNTLRYKADKGR